MTERRASSTLDGWKEIAAHIVAIGGPEVDERTLRRWACGEDPMPLYSTPGGRRVLCQSDELDAWWRRVSRRHRIG